MNFQTNKQPSIKIIGETSKPKCPSLRLKTCLSDHSDPEQPLKRFQRSTTKMGPTTSNPPTNRLQSKTNNPDTKNKIPLMESKLNKETTLGRSDVREGALELGCQRFISLTVRDGDGRGVGVGGELQAEEKLQDWAGIENRNYQLLKTQQYQKQLYPFRTITTHSSQTNLKNPILTLDQPKQSPSQKQSPRNTLKNLFQKHTKTYSYCQIANTSTESTIPDTSRTCKKITIGSQTQNKRHSVAVGTVHVNVKCGAVKVQTQISGGFFQRVLEEMKGRLAGLEEENRKLKLQLGAVSKEKEELAKAAKQAKQQNQKQSRSILSHRPSQNNLLKLHTEPSPQSFKQISLQSLIATLKQQIQSIKSGLGMKKVQQILQSVKRQNVSLINQLQSVSLKCRVLEQQNNQLVGCEQESRKLKMEVKYFRGSIKDHQMEIQRLKGEIKKMRNMPKTNAVGKVFQQSRVVSAWGSETDSLNLSVSFIRD